MSKKPVSIVIAGVGGYGYYYFKTLLEEFEQTSYTLVGVVDPHASASGHYPYIQKNKISCFDTMDEFYSAGLTADLAVIVSPIHYHVSQSVIALKNGSDVLCDKPLCAAREDADTLMAAEKESGRWCMIGYQWSFSDAVLGLKEDIIKGRFGKPKRARALCLWPRGFDYYGRNTWAGKIITEDGKPVFDSPANNAAAHFLHNLFFLTGAKMHTSSRPLEAEAALFRTNAIENFDTVSCRIRTDQEAELFFHTSHVTEKSHDPVFEIECTKGLISFKRDGRGIIGLDGTGGEIHYGDPDQAQFKKLHDAVHWAGQPHLPLCGTGAARSQTECINILQEKADQIKTFRKELIRENKTENRIWVDRLYEKLLECYSKNMIL